MVMEVRKVLCSGEILTQGVYKGASWVVANIVYLSLGASEWVCTFVKIN